MLYNFADIKKFQCGATLP